MKPVVAIVMGSSSDLDVMNQAKLFLDEFDVPSEVKIISAHRDPENMLSFAKSAKENGYKIIIAGAGGAAHLPGMIASATTLPVIGVPVKSSNSIDGWDSVLSILQMPNGVPVATVGLNCAKNAAILATSILSTSDENYSKKLESYKTELKEKVQEQNNQLFSSSNK